MNIIISFWVREAAYVSNGKIKSNLGFLKSAKIKFKRLTGKYDIAFALAGGGCKALYALGVGYKIRSWGLRIREISGVSAGSAFALSIISENEEEAIEYFEEMVKRNKSNFRWLNLLQGKRPFPHENMYRRAIKNSLDLDKIKESGARVFIQAIKAFPRKHKMYNFWNKLNLVPASISAVLLDDRDKERGILNNRVAKIVKKWNLQEIIFTEEDFTYPEIVEQIIMNSSSVPPVVSMQRIKGEYYFDGGLTNNLLLEKFSPGLKRIGVYYEDSTVIGKDPEILKGTYLIRPKRNLPITSFDYTNAPMARATYELGKWEAELHKEKIMEFLKS
ncbi:MAG: patatin-like phospholipase family protein [Leptospira sp.]|nr:patatin-like phospholipase family protein [Leptospira sp.]